jgi:hypothetical protein
MTEAQDTQGMQPRRFGLTQDAIFRLWFNDLGVTAKNLACLKVSPYP